MPVLRTEHLGKTFGGRIPFKALSDVTFDVDEGEFLAIMGPSGSGKSTLLNVLSTIDVPTEGRVTIAGQDPHGMGDDELARFRRKFLGFVFQDFNLVNTLTVAENIMLPLVLEGVHKSEILQRVKEVAAYLDITPLLDKRTFEISGGQAQRTAIARAVVGRPSLLLADEPTGNLDSKAKHDVLALFQRINKELRTTILMVTHEPLAASYCGRSIIIKDGSIHRELMANDDRAQFHRAIVDVMNGLGGADYDIA